MFRYYAVALPIVLLCFLVGCGGKLEPPPPEPPPRFGNWPRSTEVALIEVINEWDIQVQAAGVGEDTASALLDARRATVHFVLLGGTDPLLNTAEKRRKFELLAEDLFAEDQVHLFITWESRGVKGRIQVKDGIKLSKQFTINKRLLVDYLNDRGLPVTPAEDSKLVELPMIMVMPEVGPGENPVELMSVSAYLKIAASTIESYLTARQYEVQVPTQMAKLQNLFDTQRQLSESSNPDIGYQLALQIVGSDVYITYTAQITDEILINTTLQKASVGIKAFETTTGRLLGADTGHSKARQGVPEAALIEEAINKAIDSVLSRVYKYWLGDQKKGSQYKLIFSINEQFDRKESEAIAFAVQDIIEESAKSFQEVIATERTLDYQVWLDRDQFKTSRNFYRALQERFAKKFADGEIASINLNRKLLLLEIIPKG